MRVTLKLLSLLSCNAFKLKRQVPNFVKHLTQQQVTKSNQERLTGRLFLYLTENQQSPTSEIKDVNQNQDQIHKFNTNELISFSNCLIKSRERSEIVPILDELDKEYCLRLPKLSPSDILRLLNVCMSINPDKITRSKFYQQSIKVLHKSLHTLSNKDLLQFVFYVGMRKKHSESQAMLRECMKRMKKKFIENLTSEELCIICNSTFKTSTKIVNKDLLEKVRSYINNNLSVLNDAALFVTLVKTLRHNRYQNDDLLNTILCTISFNKTLTLYSFTANCHIMSLFADYFFYDDNFFKIMSQKCMEQLSESSYVSKNLHPVEQLRAKDIKRFLWILSMFSEMKLVSHSDIKNVIIKKLLERIEIGEFDGDADSLVDITLFLWMLNYQAKEIVPYLFSEKNRHLLQINPKTKLRLNLLLQAVFIENRELSKKIPIKPVHVPSDVYSDYQLQKRPLIQRLLYNLQGLRKKLNLDKFEFSQDIPHLNILGITGYKCGKKKAVHIEVLDDYTRIRNVEDDVPVGLMALKLRLLDQGEEGILVVSQREVDDMTDAEINEYLLDELRLIC